MDSKTNLPLVTDSTKRCNGYIYSEGRQLCPRRDSCARFLDQEIKNNKKYKWIFICGSNQLDSCTMFISKEK